jgi:hypothetical protein
MQANHPLIMMRLDLGRVQNISANTVFNANYVECTADALSRYDLEVLTRIATRHTAVMSFTARDSKIIINFQIPRENERT